MDIRLRLTEKEYTQYCYIKCKEICEGDTESLIEYIDYLKENGKLEDLKDMEGLSEFELQLIEEKLKQRVNPLFLI